MNAIILSIGDELTLGQTVDTNSAWLSQQAAALGIRPIAHLTVSDAQADVEEALRYAAPRCTILLISGGLGPTDDDLTRHALAAAMNQPLELDTGALENVERFFRAINRTMPERNRIQAMIPRGAQMIENTAGTAPGIRAALVSGGSHSCEVFIMPGVPKEMKIMFQRSVAPALETLRTQQGDGAASRIILSRTLHTFGLGESAIAEKLGDLMNRTRNPSVGTTVSAGVVSLRLNAYFDSRDRAQNELDATEALCRAALGDLIYGRDDQTLPQVIATLLKERGKMIATAESCTGGLLAKYLTDIPGSSAYFERGWVTYSNDAKVNSLGIAGDLITDHGAVSEEVVEAMACEAYLHSGADCALAISGIAGPDGGTPEKPVGTVCIGLYAESAEPPVQTRTFLFPGDREMIRDRAAKMALTMLRYQLLGRTLDF